MVTIITAAMTAPAGSSASPPEMEVKKRYIVTGIAMMNTRNDQSRTMVPRLNA
jgi:hypothetical protein